MEELPETSCLTSETEAIKNVKEDRTHPFRRLLPQLLITLIFHILFFNQGMSSNIPTIIIPVLANKSHTNNQNETTIHLTPEETSWLGGISSIAQAVGCVLSGILSELIGRKKSLFIITLPSIIGWLLLYLASTKIEIFSANVLFGLSYSSTVTVVGAYMVETTEPSSRTILQILSGSAIGVGGLALSMLNTIIDWRRLALYSLFLPLLSFLPLFWIPESPYFFGVDQQSKAIKSLKWLRGWVSSKAVMQELRKIEQNKELSNYSFECPDSKLEFNHSQNPIKERFHAMKQSATIKPFIILSFFTFIMNFNGTGARVYAIQIVKAFGSPYDDNSYLAVLGLCAISGTFFTMIMAKWLGKRKLFMFGSLGSALSLSTLAIYGTIYSMPNFSSFDVISDIVQPMKTSRVGAISFAFRTFYNNIIYTVISQMYCECFPLKTRSFAIGLIIFTRCLIDFASTKLHYNFELWLTLSGSFILYAMIAVIGLILGYLILPETESQRLEDIEKHFSSPNRRWIDCHIQPDLETNE